MSSIQDKRLMRRMMELWPLRDPIIKERESLDKMKFTKVTTFVVDRAISREISFYYLLHNQVIDFVKVLTAEEIKDIYLGNHPDYSSMNELVSPIFVVLLGKEAYNKLMINILNIFVDNFSRNMLSKALIFTYEGTKQDFDYKYKNLQERGILNCGQLVTIKSKAKVTKEYC